jgi:hypothetical protein
MKVLLILAALGSASTSPPTHPPIQPHSDATRPPIQPKRDAGPDERQSSCSCPTTNPFAAFDRIVGGQATGKPVPWQVKFGDCAGIIIGKRHILSARHCFSASDSATELFVSATPAVAGLYNQNPFSPSDYQRRSVARILAPGTYNENTAANDIIIVELSADFTFNENVQPACLPTAEPAVGTTAYASGWGTLEAVRGGSTPAELQFVRGEILSDDVCQQIYSNSNYGQGQIFGSISNSFVCAGGGGKRACHGDSGGPLVQFANGKIEVVGIVSTGPCDQFPTLYTRITPFLGWINGIVGDACSGGGSDCNGPWIDDGFCDDINNNAGCQYDGGDCCGPNANTQYCTVCGCLDCNVSWIGDNFCDDVNNNAGCQYDGGDCCGSNTNTQYCTVCGCWDPYNYCYYYYC